MIFIDVYIYVDKVLFNIFKIEEQNEKSMVKDELIIPKSFDIGAKLNYLRKFMIVLVNQYKISKATISVEDAIGVDILNVVKMEAIIEEIFADCGVTIWK